MVDEYADNDRHADTSDMVKPTAEPPQSFMEAFWRWLFPTSTDRAAKLAERLRLLDQAIYKHPEAPTNYVLRGELYLKIGDYDAAYTDFVQALDQAAQQVESAEWGLVAQAMQDRALVGKRAAEKRLGRT